MKLPLGRLWVDAFHDAFTIGCVTLPELIDLLGGEAAVAEECGCTLAAVCNWKARGLPKGRCLDLGLMAKRRGLRICAEGIATELGLA